MFKSLYTRIATYNSPHFSSFSDFLFFLSYFVLLFLPISFLILVYFMYTKVVPNVLFNEIEIIIKQKKPQKQNC
jgi:hypothetical protein